MYLQKNKMIVHCLISGPVEVSQPNSFLPLQWSQWSHVTPSSRKACVQKGTFPRVDPSSKDHRNAAMGRMDHKFPRQPHHRPKWSSWNSVDLRQVSRHANVPVGPSRQMSKAPGQLWCKISCERWHIVHEKIETA